MKTLMKQVFTEEFRAEAVKLVVDQGLSQSEVARRQHELAETGFTMSISSVTRLRAELGLRCKQVRKYKATTDSKYELPVASNLLWDR